MLSNIVTKQHDNFSFFLSSFYLLSFRNPSTADSASQWQYRNIWDISTYFAVRFVTILKEAIFILTLLIK